MPHKEPTATEASETGKSSARRRADGIRAYRCRHLIAVIENPENPRNIGTVLRNVNAFGVEKVYVIDWRGALPDDWQDLRERRGLSKLSASASRWTSVKRYASTAACVDYLRLKNFRSVVTSPHVKGKRTEALEAVDYTAFPKLAVWFGNEGFGISAEAVEAAELCITIPMFGMVESLNLGTTSGIVLNEVTRQRRAYQALYRKRNRRSPIAPAGDGGRSDAAAR